MKKINLLTSLVALFTLVGCNGGTSSSTNSSSSKPEENKPCVVTEDNKVHLILLAGQSGARGKAVNGDLSEDEKEPNYDVDIMADGLMMPALSNIPESIDYDTELEEVKPGFGDTAGEFGPELGMAQTMASRYPKDGEARKSVIVKYTACGSTFISDWYTKSLAASDEYSDKLDYKQARTDDEENIWGPLTSNFFQLIDWTIDNLESEGYEVVIDGCAFIHGEQDTKYDENMALYEAALEYFVKDVRSYVQNETLPFVIAEALTNSGKYCNDLKAMQKRVADKLDNCSLVTNEGLKSNTFEPWHFGKESNYVIGNRIAAEIIAYNDTRVVKSFEENTLKVPANAEVTLPKYVVAEFENGYTGYTKINYTSSYDKTTKGMQEVTFEASGCQSVTGKLNVNVCDEVYVDGIMNEYEGRKSVSLGELGNIYVTKGEEGLYVSAKINDKEIWTDGESWHNGDMGQAGTNDDFRVYLTTSGASERTSLLLSAANLLRIYGDGNTHGNPGNNWVYKNLVDGYDYRVTTHGLVNTTETESGGVEFELYVTYDSLNVEADDIKLCFNYNDISSVKNKRVQTNHYYTADGYSNGENLESNDASYISINELI